MNLFDASRQWAIRPPDQRFRTLAEMHAATLGYRRTAAEAVVPVEALRIEAEEGELVVAGRTESRAVLTHWATDQLCRYADAPAGYLRRLPATLAAQNLNHGLKQMVADHRGDRLLLFHRNGRLVLRALTSTDYARIWNHEVIERLQGLPGGWAVPPARPALPDQPGAYQLTAEEKATWGSRTLVEAGDWCAPAGLYASDHDMFAYLIDPTRVINDGTEHGLVRGLMVSNCEVGPSGGSSRARTALWVKTFMLRYTCGNHIAWDVTGVTEVRVIHVGDAGPRAWRELAVTVRQYLEAPGAPDEARIRTAQARLLGDGKDEVLDFLFGRGVATKGQLEAAYVSTEQHPEDGNPRSAWGMAQGLTRLSQDTAFADDRAALDAAAGKVLKIAF